MRIFISLVALIMSTQMILAQRYTASQADGKLTIAGTSSLHDWESEVTDFKVDATLDFAKASSDIKVVVKSNSIKSGKSIMDTKTYESLLVEKFPEIIFTSKQTSFGEGKFTSLGTVQITGKKLAIEIPVTYSNVAGKLNVTGLVKFKMSDFGIDPPTAMFGTMVTGDEVTINFNLSLNQL